MSDILKRPIYAIFSHKKYKQKITLLNWNILTQVSKKKSIIFVLITKKVTLKE